MAVQGEPGLDVGRDQGPALTTSFPATTVWRAATGPQRSHASTGSVMAPANAMPSSGQHDEVADGADRQLTDLAGAAEAGRPAPGRHLERVAGAGRAPARPAAGRAAWRCGPPSTATPSRSTTSRRSRGRPARRRPGARAPGRCRRRRSSCSSSGSAPRRHPSAEAARSRPRSGRCSAPPTTGRCTSRRPRSARSVAPAEALEAVGVLVGGPRPGGCAGARRAARPARRCAVISSGVTENGEHGASAIRTIAPGAAVVVPADEPLGVGEDRVVVLHHRVGRQAAVLLRQAHRAPGRVEPQPELLRGARSRR